MKELLLKLKMIADNKDFNKSVKQSNQQLKDVSVSAEKAGYSVEKSGKQAKSAGDNYSHAAKNADKFKLALSEIADISGKVGRVVGSNLAAGTGIATTATAAFTVSILGANKELNTLSAQLDISKQALQTWGIAGNDVGFSLEKVGDIFKDLNDKSGDFAATGGGEAKEIFDRLNLSINEFIGLPADKKLLALAGAFDELGSDISLEEKTFLLEAMGNDASRLLPLLENNAEKFRELEKLAQSDGRIFSDDQFKILDDATEKLKEIKSSAGAVKDQIGLIGAEIVNAFGDDLIGIFNELNAGVQAFANNFVVGNEIIRDSGQDTTGLLQDLWGFTFETALTGWRDLPLTTQASYASISSYTEAWYHDTASAYYGAQGAFADTMAEMLASGAEVFPQLASLGYKMTASIVGGLADVAKGLDILSGGDGQSGLEQQLRGLANSASQIEFTSDATDRLSNSAKRAAIEHRQLAAESRLAGMEAANSAIEQLEANSKARESYLASRDSAKDYTSALDRMVDTNKKGRINQEAINEALGLNADGTEKASAGNKKLAGEVARLEKAQRDEIASLELRNQQLKLSEIAAYSAGLSSRNFADSVIAEAESLKYSNILLAERKKLTEEAANIGANPVQSFANELTSKGLSGSDVALLADQKRENILKKITSELDKQKALITATGKDRKLIEATESGLLKSQAERVAAYQAEIQYLEEFKRISQDIADISLNPVDKYRNQLEREGFDSGDIERLAGQKQLAIYKELSTELDRQAELIGKSREETRRIELSAEGITGHYQDLIIAQERSLSLDQDKQKAFQQITQGIQSAIQSALSGNGFDFSGIADGLQESFKTRVFDAAFDADFSGATSFSDVLAGFQKNSFGSNVADYANSYGLQGFGGAGNYSNMQYGAAVAGGGAVGGALFGSGGDIGGSIGAGIGMAVAGPVGAAVGTALGGLAGSIVGGSYEQSGSGITLSYSGGSVTGNSFTEETKDGGLFGGDKTRVNFSELDSALAETLNDYFDTVEQSLLDQSDRLQEFGLGYGADAAQAVIDGITSAEDLAAADIVTVANQFTGMFGGMVSDMLADASGVSEEAIRAAQDSYSKLDLTGKTAEQQQRLVDEWAAETQEDLYRAVLGSDFDVLADLADGNETISQTTGRLITQYDALNNIIDIVGGTFDATGTQALQASDSIAELFGGLDSLQKSAAFFYENYFTAEERKNRLLQDSQENTDRLNSELNSLGYESITTRQGLREFIAGLDETTEEGQQAYYVALQLAQSLDVLKDAEEEAAKAAEQAAKEQKKLVASLTGDISSLAGELFGTDADSQISALRDRIDAENSRIDEINQAIADRYQTELETYRQMQAAADDIGDYINSLQLSDLSTLNPYEKLQEAERQYNATLEKARAGDVDAAKEFIDVARQRLEVQRNFSASGGNTSQVFDTVNTDLAEIQALMDAMPEPVKPADISSIVAERLERQIAAIERQEEILRNQNIAQDLADRMQQLSLATGKDISELAREFDISIQRLTNEFGAAFSRDDSGSGDTTGTTTTNSGGSTYTADGYDSRTHEASNSADTPEAKAFELLSKEVGEMPDRIEHLPWGKIAISASKYQVSIPDFADYLRNVAGLSGQIVGPTGSYAVGTDSLSRDGLIMAHSGEMIHSASDSTSIRKSVVSILSNVAETRENNGSGNERLERLVGQLIEENRMLRTEVQSIRSDLNDIADESNEYSETANGLLSEIQTDAARRLNMVGNL